MAFIKETPDQQQSGNDLTFFSEGVRFSHQFIEREGLQEHEYAWIFVDTDRKGDIGFNFLLRPAPQALKLTKSGGSTSGKTISCVFLKKYPWIKNMMEAEEIGKRRFMLKRMTIKSNGGEYEVYLVDFLKHY